MKAAQVPPKPKNPHIIVATAFIKQFLPLDLTSTEVSMSGSSAAKKKVSGADQVSMAFVCTSWPEILSSPNYAQVIKEFLDRAYAEALTTCGITLHKEICYLNVSWGMSVQAPGRWRSNSDSVDISIDIKF